MQKSAVFSLIVVGLWLPAQARPKAVPQPKVTRLSSDENSYTYQNYRASTLARPAALAAPATRGQAASYNQSYSHIIPPDGFQGTPTAYSLGPGWANRWGSYSSGTTPYPYNAGGFNNTGFFNGGFYPGGTYTYYRQ
ncbi:hypothetical protein JST97_24135 [bacterium]|nr:hypothetical protein [bacterium]